MAKQNVKNEGDERLESIETTLTKAEQFVIDNQKSIIVVLAILLVAVVAFFGAKKYYFEPREEEVTKAFRENNFEIIERYEDGGWLCFVCKKK